MDETVHKELAIWIINTHAEHVALLYLVSGFLVKDNLVLHESWETSCHVAQIEIR